MKYGRHLIFALTVLTPVLSGCGPAETKQLTMGTGSAGGAFFPIGTGIGDIVTKNVLNVKLTAETTGSAVENPRLVGSKEADCMVKLLC